MSYLFTGIIFPERTNLSINQVTAQVGETKFQINISLSKVHVVVTDHENQSVADLRNVLFTICNDLVNYAGFEYGYGYTVHLESCVDLDTNQVDIFGVDGTHFNENALGQKVPSFKPRENQQLSIPISALGDRYFCRATQELRNSIRYPDYTAIHCQFAIEAIRNSFADNEKVGWENMRNALKIKKETLLEFYEAALSQKHGRNKYQSWEQRQNAMQIAWEVVHRYRLFRLEDLTLKDLKDF